MQNSHFAPPGAAASLTCGVALCTCNGIDYIEAQLDSLLAQQRRPDRMVIFDDCSDDGTWEWLQTWSVRCPIPLHLHRHAVRQGVTRNFESAVKALDTDLIFLCDQDDIWFPDKLARMAGILEQRGDLLLLHTDAQLVDADGRDLHLNLLQALGVSRTERAAICRGDAFMALCRRNLVTGATAAFRRSLLDRALPFPATWLHDEWLAMIAAGAGGVDLLETATIQYRQHGRNAVGVQARSFGYYLQRLRAMQQLPAGGFQKLREARINALHDRLRTQTGVQPQYLDAATKLLNAARRRAALPSNPLLRSIAVLRELCRGGYHRYSSGWPSVARDLINR